MQKLLLFFVLAATFLYCRVEDHLKKVSDKTGFQGIKNIDFIYLINLDQRPEKLASCKRQLDPYGIVPYRFSAINGWEDLTLEMINDVGVKFGPGMQGGKWATCYLPTKEKQPFHEIVQTPGRTYFCHCMALGPIGCALSHLSVLQDAYDSGYETVWIMEDDIEVLQSPHLLSDLIERLDSLVGKEGWDVLFTDPDSKNYRTGNYVPCFSYAWRPNFSPSDPNKFAIRKIISPDFKQVGARYGAYSWIVRRSGIKKILDFIKEHQIFLPFDMEYTQPPGIKMFALNYDLVSTQNNAPSDNGAPNYFKREE